MNPEAVPIWVAVATGVLAIGSIIVKEALQMVRSKVEGVKNDDVRPEDGKSADGVDLSVVSNLTQVIQSMETQISRLSAKVDKSDARLEKIEAEIEVERSLKWVAIQHLRTLYAWIARQGFGADVPDVPEELAPHVVVPGKENR